MYVDWYGVCMFVVISVVYVIADYGRVYVFHVCLIGVLFIVLGFMLMYVI